MYMGRTLNFANFPSCKHVYTYSYTYLKTYTDIWNICLCKYIYISGSTLFPSVCLQLCDSVSSRGLLCDTLPTSYSASGHGDSTSLNRWPVWIPFSKNTVGTHISALFPDTFLFFAHPHSPPILKGQGKFRQRSVTKHNPERSTRSRAPKQRLSRAHTTFFRNLLPWQRNHAFPWLRSSHNDFRNTGSAANLRIQMKGLLLWPHRSFYSLED